MNEPSEKEPLIQDGEPNDGQQNEEPKQEQPEKKEAFYKRHKCFTICCVIFWGLVVFMLIFAFAIVPAIAPAIMQRVFDKSDLAIEQVQLISQHGTVYTVRVQAWLTYSAPIELDGESEETSLEMLVENPKNRTELMVAGRLEVPSLRSTGTRTFMNVTTTMEILDDRAAHLFMGDMLVAENFTIWGRGSVVIHAEVPLYKKMSATIKVEKASMIKGYKDMDFTLNYMLLENSNADDITMDFNITIHNPSIIYTSFPIRAYAQNLGIYYKDVWIGTCLPDNLLIGEKEAFNHFPGTLFRTPENEEYIADFLSNYILGNFVFLYVQGTAKLDLGFPYTEENPADIYIPWLLPGITDQLIQDIACPLDEVDPIRLILAAEGKMFNPLLFPVELLRVEFDAYVGHPCNKTVGRINESWDGFAFPPRDPICLKGLSMKVTLADVRCMTQGIVTGLYLWANDGVMRMRVGVFEIEIPFSYGPILGSLGKCRL